MIETVFDGGCDGQITKNITMIMCYCMLRNNFEYTLHYQHIYIFRSSQGASMTYQNDPFLKDNLSVIYIGQG